MLSLLRPSRFFKNLIGILSKDTLSFSLFVGGLAGIYKFMLCSMRRLRGRDDGFNAVVAGALAGLSLAFEASGNRKRLLFMYIFVRGLDVLVTLLDKRGYIKKIKNFEAYLFGPVIAFLVYAYFYELDVFPPGIDKAFMATASPTKVELMLASDVYLRQGYRWFPGVAKKLIIK